MTKFVITGTQRSGTTFIRHCLNSHDDIRCHGEVFQKRYKEGDGYYNYLGTSFIHKLRHYLNRSGVMSNYLDAVYSSGSVDNVGIKLMYSQVRNFPYAFPMAISYIKRNNIKVLHVVRRNVLKTYISRVSAIKRNMFHAKQTQSVDKISLEINDLVSQLKKIDFENKAWVKIFGDGYYMRLDYEDFITSKEAKTKEILAFLNIDNFQELTSSNVKINPDDMRELITNYDEMVECLTGSEFEYCLERGCTSAR